MPKKKHAWMSLQEHHMPQMKGMELGKRYTVTAEIEPTHLSNGENEYDDYESSPIGGGNKMTPKVKKPMQGKFKVHSIKASAAKKGGKTGRYE